MKAGSKGHLATVANERCAAAIERVRSGCTGASRAIYDAQMVCRGAPRELGNQLDKAASKARKSCGLRGLGLGRSRRRRRRRS
jgi:hypothetical protein